MTKEEILEYLNYLLKKSNEQLKKEPRYSEDGAYQEGKIEAFEISKALIEGITKL